jgi:hypothetical protein
MKKLKTDTFREYWLPFCFLTKNVKIKICKTIIIPVLYDHEILSLKYSLSVLGIRVLSRMFGLRRRSNRKL